MAEPFRGMFQDFLRTYIEASRDFEILEVLPPFLAFRARVIAHSRWYQTFPWPFGPSWRIWRPVWRRRRASIPPTCHGYVESRDDSLLARA